MGLDASPFSQPWFREREKPFLIMNYYYWTGWEEGWGRRGKGWKKENLIVLCPSLTPTRSVLT